MNEKNELNEKMLENVTGGCGIDGMKAAQARIRREEAAKAGGYGGASEKF